MTDPRGKVVLFKLLFIVLYVLLVRVLDIYCKRVDAEDRP